MTRALWLADVLSDAFRGRRGFQVDVIPGWEGRGRDGIDPRGVIDHHTGAGSYHGLLDYMAHGSAIAPLCNTATCRPHDGVVRVTVVAAGKANHAGRGQLPWTGQDRGNWHAIGQEHQNDGRQPWPAQQLEAIAVADRAILDHLGVGPDRLDLHCTYAVGRKVDMHSTDLDDHRGRCAAIVLRSPTMSTREYAQAVVCWSAVDVEHGRVLATAYGAALVQGRADGLHLSVTHPGDQAKVGFAWLVGQAATKVDPAAFPDGTVAVAGPDRNATAGQLAQTLLEHPPDTIRRRGRPW